MKTIFTVSLVACMAIIGAGHGNAAETKDAGQAATKANLRDSQVKPHFKATGAPVSAARGEAIFVDHCALCHGLHGKGDGPRSAFFQQGVQYIPDLTFEGLLKGRDKELLQSISEGLRRLPEPAYVMPQFKYILSEEEIKSVLAYVKTLPAAAKKH